MTPPLHTSAIIPSQDRPLPVAHSAPTARWLFFCLWAAAFCLLFWKPLFGVFQLAMRDDTYSYILLIPFIFAWLLYSDRKQLLPVAGVSIWPSLIFLVPGILLAFFPSRCASCSLTSYLSLYSASLVFLLVAGFILILGRSKARASAFSLAFLAFAIPIPDFLLAKVIYWLQAGSAAVASVLFDLSGAPVLREGFVFRLPKISIEVAQECSGIRSSMALLILALILAHFAFRPFWKKSTFVVAGLCMMLVKNGIRIASLTLLANYVNPNFLYGNLHHRGGIVFFLIGLALLFPVFWFLRRGEASPVLQPLSSSK
jgi:exosortase